MYAIYTAPLSADIRQHNLIYRRYVDATQIYVHCNNNMNFVRDFILCFQNFISDVSSWMSKNTLKIKHQTDTACSWLVCQSGGLFGGTLCKMYPPTPEVRPPSFLGKPCVPATWLAERLLLAGDIESNPGPKPTLKTLTHTRTQPPTITKYINSSIQPPQTRPPPLSLVHPPPKTPTSVQPGYVVKVRTDHGYVVKQCPRIVINKIFDWH